jgi:hypothetical protein
MRKDLVFRYLSSLETQSTRLTNQLYNDSYTNLIQHRSTFSSLTLTEIEFMIDRLLAINSSLEELYLALDKEKDQRNQIS